MNKDQKSFSAGKKCNSGIFFVRYLCWVSFAALILRLIASWEMAQAGDGINNVLAPLPTSDLATYMTLGRECAAGNFPETFYYQPWYYAVFLAGCNIVTSSIWLVIVIQAFLSAATVWITGWCGKKVFSETAGMIAAGLCAVSSSLILYVPFCQNETLQTFHLIGIFALTLLALEKHRSWLWALTGLAVGIGILTRGNIWLIFPAVIAGLLICGRKDGILPRKLFLHCAVLIFFALLIQVPFIIRNTMNSTTLTGASTAAGAVLALGNTPEAPAGGRNPGETAGAMAYPEAYRRMMNNTNGNFARSVPEQMWAWMCDDPAAFFELQFRKALLFWDGREIPNNVSLEYDGIMASKILRYLVIGRNHIIFMLGAAGFLFFLGELFKKSRRELTMLYAFTGIFYVAVVIFYILSRFKAPAIPFLTIFGGGVVSAWILLYREALPEKRFLAIGRIAIFLLAGCFFSCSAYNAYRDCEAMVNRWIYPDGIELDMQGENIQLFDYGPYPFGGWSYQKLTPGDRIMKNFSRLRGKRIYADFGLMVNSIDAVDIVFQVNGVVQNVKLPAVEPGKNTRRMIPLRACVQDGNLEVAVLSISGGEVWAVYDIQRQYDRSAFNDAVLDGEWVVRAVIAR